MRKGLSLVVVLSVIIGTLLMASVVFAQATPSVTVAPDQALVAGGVTVQRVVAAQAGWIVIHADNNGAPGADLGHAAVKAGENTNVVVPITAANATPKMYAMLHVDAGVAGTYEFPGADVPVSPLVSPAFNVSGLPGAAQGTATRTATAAATVAATATRAATAMATAMATRTAAPAAMATATRTAAPATLPTTGGGSMLVMALLGLGGLSLLGGVGLNFLRRNAR